MESRVASRKNIATIPNATARIPCTSTSHQTVVASLRAATGAGVAMVSRLLLVAASGVEAGLGQLPQQRADVPDRLGGAVQAVHAGVLPLDRDRAVVADRGQRAERVLPRDVAVAGRHEVPAAARVAPGQVRAEDARAARGRADPG